MCILTYPEQAEIGLQKKHPSFSLYKEASSTEAPCHLEVPAKRIWPQDTENRPLTDTVNDAPQ
jgi:hypothetical protein